MINQLNGLTVLRFTKAFRSGGGIELHLDALDRTFLRIVFCHSHESHVLIVVLTA